MSDQGVDMFVCRKEPRHPVLLKSHLRLAIDSDTAVDEAVSDVMVTDISCNGLSASDVSSLMAGERVTLDVPLIGSREAEVRWVVGNRAGCRFTDPLTHEELRTAVFASPAIVEKFPGLALSSMH